MLTLETRCLIDPPAGKCVRLMAIAKADGEMAGKIVRLPVPNHEPQTQSRLSTWQSNYTEPPQGCRQ